MKKKHIFRTVERSKDTNIVSFYDKKVTKIPSELFEFDLLHLERLDLSINEISEIPPEIGNLVNLKRLDLVKNKITRIPRSIGNLVNLDRLNIAANKIRKIPAAIGNLVNLDRLDLKMNKIEEIPPEIGNLVNLYYLDLCQNKIKELPPEIGNLVALDFLDLRENKIKHIPAAIGNLLNLNYLDLRDNKIEEIPAEIGNLANLSYLNLRNNQIETIPAEISNLSKLEFLDLEENPIAEIHPDLFKEKEPPEIYLTYHPKLKIIPKQLAGKIALNSIQIPEKYCDIPLQEWHPRWIIEAEERDDHEWISDSEKIALKRIKNILFEIIGFEKILAEFKSRKIDSWNEYHLLEITEQLDTQPVTLLIMPDRNSNSEVKIIRVPYGITSVRQGMKWLEKGIDYE